jgi:hypothetical protein
MMGFTAAAVAVPLLLLLYFLRLKRREQVVSSTFLWQRTVRDFQVNAPFQRLRRNWLLLLQLLALLLAIASLGGPVLSLAAPQTRRTVILLDRSASMNARDGNAEGTRTRLEEAKAQARTLIRSLLETHATIRGRAAHQIMIVTFARQAQVCCNFTSDRRQLEQALAAVVPTDQEASLREALSVSRAFAQAPGAETNNRSAEDPARLVLFSDGGIRDLDQVTVGVGELEYRALGRREDNVAITALQARRSYERPEEVRVFALLSNFGPRERTLDVQIRLDGRVAGIRAVTLPAAAPGARGSEPRPGRRGLEVVLSAPEAELLEVRHLAPDVLPSDDVAWAVLRVPRQPRVLLVTRDNPVLASALQACLTRPLTSETPEVFGARDAAAWETAPPFDIVVLDNVTLPAVPRGNYLILGSAPPPLGITPGQAVASLLAVDWRRRHPVLRHVNLARVFVARSRRWTLPREATVLADFTEGPALAVLQRDRRQAVWVGFDVLESNWPFEPGFVMFCQNALAYLHQSGVNGQDRSLSPGDPILLTGYPADRRGQWISPHADPCEVTTDAAGRLRIAGLARAGVYRAVMPGYADRALVVNSLSEQESRIRTRTELPLGGQRLPRAEGSVRRTNVALWPWLVVTLLILVWGEWIVYNGRMRFH